MEEFRPEGPGRIWSRIRARWERARRRRRLVKGKKEAPFVMAKAALPVLSLGPLLAMLLSTPILSMMTPGRWARNRNKTSRRPRLQARWHTLFHHHSPVCHYNSFLLSFRNPCNEDWKTSALPDTHFLFLYREPPAISSLCGKNIRPPRRGRFFRLLHICL
jgi:hypothetical protein